MVVGDVWWLIGAVVEMYGVGGVGVFRSGENKWCRQWYYEGMHYIDSDDLLRDIPFSLHELAYAILVNRNTAVRSGLHHVGSSDGVSLAY
ncbi:hypothetical protein Tco_1388404 [Tanacetum coccineum]